MKLDILNLQGESTGKKANLSNDVFGIEPNDHVLYLDVKQYLANQRQGTHSTKERSDLSGSTRKIKKQKGTGTARAGDIKSPLFRGGARVFGPEPRYYGFKLNKKVKTLARKSALSYKAADKNIIIIEDFLLENPKTRDMMAILKNLGVENKKSLFLTAEKNDNVCMASRNIQNFKIFMAAGLNTYQVMNAQKLLITESALKVIEETLTK